MIPTAVERFEAGERLFTIADIQALQAHMENVIAALIQKFERQAPGCVMREIRLVRMTEDNGKLMLIAVSAPIEID
jgi:hypothetical protein